MLVERLRVRDDAAVVLEQVVEVQRALLAGRGGSPAEKVYTGLPTMLASICALVFRPTTAAAW